MIRQHSDGTIPDGLAPRARTLFAERRAEVCGRIDQLFVALMVLQLIGICGAAIWIAPHTWIARHSMLWHTRGAMAAGFLVTCIPTGMALLRPSVPLTRHVVAMSQMLVSSLLIHLTGGRIETHFHIFGSLALLSFYRDWRVFATATAVIIADHFGRGVWWPESIFGLPDAGPWRWLEHASWVIIEVTFLANAAFHIELEMRQDAVQRAQLESTNERIEREVALRTADLEQSRAMLQANERLLRENLDQLENKNRDLDEFTYVASHDLQEPVRKLVSFSKLLRQDVGANLNAQAEKDLTFIVEAAQRMRDLIQDLLALSRAGRSAMKVERISLATCARRACESLELRIRESEAAVEIGELPDVSGDATVLTQLFQNLIGNALKFVPNDRKPRVAVTAARNGPEWTITVADNGIGIKAEYFERIFAPFQRLHGRGEYEGTGIGLAICKKNVERHNGKIRVESEYGAGTRFHFTLPAEKGTSPCSIENDATRAAWSSC